MIIQQILFPSPLTEDKYFSLGEWLSTGTGCRERQPNLHPWRYLKLNGAWHSASWQNVQVALLWAGVEPSRDPFLPESFYQCIIFNVCSVPPNSTFFFFVCLFLLFVWLLLFFFFPLEELIKGFKVRDISLAYPMGIVFLIPASLLLFLQNFCSSYFSQKEQQQHKSLNKLSKCLIPTLFLLHSWKCMTSQTISIPVYFISEIILT